MVHQPVYLWGCRLPHPQTERLPSAPTLGSPIPNPRLTSPGQIPKKQFEREGEKSARSFFHCLTPEKRGERQPRGNRKNQVGSPTLQPPVSPPDSSCGLKSQSLFPQNPKGKKRERERERKAQGREEAAANFKRRLICAAPDSRICIMKCAEDVWLMYFLEGLTLILFSLRRACHSNSAGHL